MRYAVALLLCLLPSVALGNAADCYWLLSCDAESIFCTNVRVVYDSGHSIICTHGDYLPVGCNVDHYEIVSETISSAKGIYANSPSCAAAHPASALIWQTGQPAGAVALVSGSLGCGGSCGGCSATNPGKPPPGSHPNPDGDDDGDGIRNECDPDEVACVDADSDGCCDSCADDCSPDDEDGDEDDDDDGIRNECDTDLQPCFDFDEDGCCDHCGDECGPPCDAETECCEGEPGYPDCDCDPDTECCPGEPGYPDCPCDPETECCPGEEGYPDCPDECMDCDPCEKLDAILASVNEMASSLGDDAGYTAIKPPITPVPSGSPPDDLGFDGAENVLPETLPEWGSATTGHLTIPVPGVEGEGVSLNFGARPLEDFAQSYLPSGALTTSLSALDQLRQWVRLILLLLVSWSFCRRVYQQCISI